MSDPQRVLIVEARFYEAIAESLVEAAVDGIEAAPAGLIGLFEGTNFGKRLVRLS